MIVKATKKAYGHPLLGVIFLLIFFGGSQAQEKPNILVLLVDDLGYHDLSITGSAIYQTPRIDALAKESVRFSNAYANYPRCVPSRYALMTATYPLTGNEVPDDGYALGTVPAEKNAVHRFNEAGYRTAFFGKWHLGDGRSSPRAMGFQVSVAAGKAGSPMSYIYPFNVPKGSNRKVKKEPIPDLDDIATSGDYLTDVLTGQVLDFIKSSVGPQPFLAVLSFYAVHQPLEAKEAGVARNREEIEAFDFGGQPEYVSEGTGRTKMRQDNPVYAAMVENMDWNVGRILDLLEQLGIENNTIVIFSSDNGGLSNDGYNQRRLATSNAPLRAGKGWFYEGGVRVPLFVKYKGVFQPREDPSSIVLLMDLFPTLIQLVGAEELKDVDGRSFLPVLHQEESWDGRTAFWYAANARPRNTGEGKSSAIRSGDWKLVHFYETGQMELYNLKADPSERVNLSKKYPDLAREMYLKLEAWKASR